MNDDPENLVTPYSLAMSLAPPRAPPHDSPNRHLMCGKDPSKAALTLHHHHHHHHENDDHYPYDDRDNDLKNYVQHGIKSRIQQLLQTIFQNSNNYSSLLPHPHLPMSPEFGNYVTRFIGAGLPLSKQNRWRDNGIFRSIGTYVCMSHHNIPILFFIYSIIIIIICFNFIIICFNLF